jgi:hypothetical protein
MTNYDLYRKHYCSANKVSHQSFYNMKNLFLFVSLFSFIHGYSQKKTQTKFILKKIEIDVAN